MREHVDTMFTLRLLDLLHVGLHALLRESLCERRSTQRGGVQACKGDELPDVAQLAQTTDKRSLLSSIGDGPLPIEAWR